MSRRITFAVVGLLIAMLTGCSTSSSTSPSAAVATPADVTGTWVGATTTGSRTITMVLRQNGADVTGNLQGAGTLDGPIEGTVDGNTIRLRERAGLQSPSLNVNGNEMSGMLSGTGLTLRRVR